MNNEPGNAFACGWKRIAIGLRCVQPSVEIAKSIEACGVIRQYLERNHLALGFVDVAHKMFFLAHRLKSAVMLERALGRCRAPTRRERAQ